MLRLNYKAWISSLVLTNQFRHLTPPGSNSFAYTSRLVMLGNEKAFIRKSSGKQKALQVMHLALESADWQLVNEMGLSASGVVVRCDFGCIAPLDLRTLAWDFYGG